MAKYVEIEKVQEMLENAQIISDGVNCGYCTEDISIDKLPAADVALVVHAEWISFLDGESIMPERYYRCSKCGRVERRREPYCHCGAKMDL